MANQFKIGDVVRLVGLETKFIVVKINDDGCVLYYQNSITGKYEAFVSGDTIIAKENLVLLK